MKRTLIITCGLLLSAGALYATTLTFDDLPLPGSLEYGYSSPVPTGYGGFTWNNNVQSWNDNGEGAAYYNNTLLTTGGYVAGAVSGHQAMLTWYANAISMSDGLFTLNSAYIGAAWGTHTVTVSGLLGGSVIFSQDITAIYASPQLFNFNFNNIDAVIFDPHGDHITIDNITVNGVPDGGLTIAMFGAAMTGLAFIRRKF
jgi:hypothetical protein